MVSWVHKVFGAAGLKEHSKIRSFPFHLLQQATKYFDDERVVGHGGFGKVYMGVLEGEKVAVKRKNPESSQGQKEFQVEIELLPGLNHRNLVSLIGYCDENNEMILVYEYMEKGTLTSHLYGSDKPSLNWKQRVEVCVGAAKGLHYLHTSSAKAIIHRDVKSANILLDEKRHAKVGDFGLSKTGPELDQNHVITEVKGSFGYFDPEYCKTKQLTEKSDVYSFGVVMLEVLCGRPVIDHKLPNEKVNLVEWGMGMLKKGELEQIVDQKISGTIKQRSLVLFGEIMVKCLAEKSVERPSMEVVLRSLVDVKNSFTRSVGGLSDPSMSRVSPVLDESISVAGNSDESDHDVSAGNSDEPHHDVSSQLIKLGEGKALTRSVAKIFRRDVPDDLSNLSVSHVSPVLDGNTMNGIVELHNIGAHESISVAGNSDESDHVISTGKSDEPDHDISSELNKLGERKALTRSVGKVFRRDVPDDFPSPLMSQVSSLGW